MKLEAKLISDLVKARQGKARIQGWMGLWSTEYCRWDGMAWDGMGTPWSGGPLLPPPALLTEI